MESVQIQVQIKYLTMIKKIIDTDTDGDKFTIARREKNSKFLKEYGLNHEDIKNILGLLLMILVQVLNLIEIVAIQGGFLNFIHYLMKQNSILKLELKIREKQFVFQYMNLDYMSRGDLNENLLPIL